MSVGERLKRRRKELGMSAEAVAEKLGVSPFTVYRYESGEINKMGIDKLKPIAEAINTTPAFLMGWSNEPSPLPPSAKIIDTSGLHKIPILGRIAAGTPIYAEENIEGYTYTDLNGGAEYFGLKVRGDSMDAAGIKDGYIVIVRRQPEVENGQIAVCLIDGQDATLKRFSRNGDIITLMPQSTNPENHPFVYDQKKTTVEILGLVVKVEFFPV